MPDGKKKSVSITVNVWYQPKTAHIHISSNEESFITTVNMKPGSDRCHRNLYLKLRKVLEAHGKWPPEA